MACNRLTSKPRFSLSSLPIFGSAGVSGKPSKRSCTLTDFVFSVALDRRNYQQVVETTVELANKAGVAEIVGRVVVGLKDENEAYRRMVMETIDKVVGDLGAADIDERLEVQLVDNLIYAFQEQTEETLIMLDGFGTVVNALGEHFRAHIVEGIERANATS